MKIKSLLKVGVFIICGALMFGNTGCKKKEGCTDSNATNYDADAEKDDGSCKYEDADQKAYDAADGIKGGQIYDKFYSSTTGWIAPSSITATDITNYGNFYRCKQCHGWDLDGKTGAYINRAAKTSRPAVAVSLREHVKEHTIKELFDDIKHAGGRKVDATLTQDGTNGKGDAMPDFGTILTNAEIWNLVKFLKEEAFDVSLLYDITTTGTYPAGTKTFSNIGKDGSASAGDIYFSSSCVSCHGTKGDGPASGGDELIIDDGDTLTVGYFGRNKSYELQHKVKFGNPGSEMTEFPNVTLQNMKDMLKALQDTTKYPN